MNNMSENIEEDVSIPKRGNTTHIKQNDGFTIRTETIKLPKNMPEAKKEEPEVENKFTYKEVYMAQKQNEKLKVRIIILLKRCIFSF